MKMKIEIKNRWTNEVLFEYEKENNTIKDTLTVTANNDAYLCGANLSNANLSNAYLYGANLSNANLSNAYLYDANLTNAYLRGADFTNADLRDANLRGADLYGANFSNANLNGANLNGANLRGAKNVPYIPMNCPSEGSFIGWKKVNGCIIKLEIPEDAKRSSATTMKCRCNKAKVLGIVNLDSNEVIDKIVNTTFDQETIYKVGEMTYPDSFDEDRWNECSHGIHFFINKEDAINY